MVDLQRAPERLRAHAARAEELVDLLRARCRGPRVGTRPRSASRARVAGDVDRIAADVTRAADQLAELARGLRAAAHAAEAADDTARRALLTRRDWA